LRLPSEQVDAITQTAAVAFANLIYGYVRTPVRTSEKTDLRTKDRTRACQKRWKPLNLSKNRLQRDTQKEASMDKCINFYEFLRYLFDDERAIQQGAEIVKALLEAQSPRLSNISEKMTGKSESNYKVIQRFLKKVDLKRLLLRFYQEDAEFMIGDPTEMERYKAPHTAYVGTLSDGKTAGYWLMVLSTPFRGRSLPCSFVVYSSRTIGDQVTSRN
jgi:hypothetical protein